MEISNEGVAPNVEGDGDNNHIEEVETELSREQAIEKLRAAAAENKRYRQSKAEIKAEKDAIETRLKELEEKAEKEKGNYKDLYAKTKEELQTERERYKGQLGTYARKVVHSSIREKLLESKCSRPDAVLKLMGEQIAELDIDDQFTPNKEGVEEIAAQAMKDFPEWFKSETPKFNDGAPVGKMPAKKVAEMTTEEIKAALAAMDKK